MREVGCLLVDGGEKASALRVEGAERPCRLPVKSRSHTAGIVPETRDASAAHAHDQLARVVGELIEQPAALRQPRDRSPELRERATDRAGRRVETVPAGASRNRPEV